MTKRIEFDLSDRTILLTGASSGIGRRFADILADSGARVILAARRKDLLDEVANAINARGGHALAVAVDASSETDVIAAYDAAEASFGPINGVIANAGINVPGAALDLPIESFERIVSVNLQGVFLTVREGARRMLAGQTGDYENRGRIIVISSTTGQHPGRDLPAYSATKAAVNHLARSLARDWAAKGINVNVIAPGYMLTDLTDRFVHSEAGQAMLGRFPRGRLMDVEALDTLLLFLCSDASSQVTGSIFTIDDGQTLGA